MKKKTLCILTMMVLGIILARGLTISIAKEKYKEHLLNKKKISMEQAIRNQINEKNQKNNVDVVDSKDTINEDDIIESNDIGIKENVEEINGLQSDDKEILVDNNYDITTEENINDNEVNNEITDSSNNWNEDLSNESSANSNIVTYDHPDRLRTESYIEVILNGEILYTKNI